MECRFIDTGPNDAYLNMAIDESLLELCSAPILRVYRWLSPSISVGYNQKVSEEINIAKCREENVHIVRRITGGKAILHDNEMTYSFILPEDSLNLPDSITESYKVISKALVASLNRVGIMAEINKQPERISTPMCFNSSNWYELSVGSKKICGSAQRRADGKILQHGSLLIDFNYEKNAALFNSDTNSNRFTASELRGRITSIKNELNREVSYKELSNAFRYGFQKNFHLKLIESKLARDEIKLAEKLKRERYETDSWNFREEAAECTTLL